jgi:hypothetical protein
MSVIGWAIWLKHDSRHSVITVHCLLIKRLQQIDVNEVTTYYKAKSMFTVRPTLLL